ncbi:MAG: CHAT domain-containing protein [Pleurocapsa sp. MO_226.B13]|nr:CHAT domain-containing protein [Pleurocapsa sp. MO_226.B13]
MLAWKKHYQKSPVAKWLKRLALMLLASLIFTHSPILFTRQLKATEPAKTAPELTLQGEQLYQLGEFDSAAKAWQQAANLYQQQGDNQKQNQSLINVSEALQANGRYLKACNTIIQVFKIDRFDCRSLTDNNNRDRDFDSWLSTLKTQLNTLTLTNGLHSFGDILQKLGRPDLSSKILQKALKIARQSSSPETEAAILVSLGNNQQILGERTQLVQQNLKFKNDSPLTCTAQVNSEAIPFYQQATSLYQQAASKLTSPNTWIKVQLNHLNLLQAMGREARAIALAQQILPKVEQLPLESNNIYPRINLAKNLICLQQNSEEIASILTTAIQQAESIGDRRGESYSLGYLGWLYEQNQQIAKAVSSTKQALVIAQSLQAQDIAYKWEWQLGHLLELENDLPGAIAAYSNAVELLQSLRRDLIGIQAETRFYFQEQVEPVYRNLVELLLQTQDNAALKLENLQQARTTIESLQLLEIENFLQQACLSPKIEIDRIIDREDATAAVIYPIILKQQLAIILKLPRQSELRYYSTAIPQEQLESTITQLQYYLPDVTRTSQVNQRSGKIYDWLIRPLERDLESSKIETLVFVLDGSLRNIPMSVLYDRQQEQYLVEKYAVSLAPGLQLVETQPIHSSRIKVLAAGISQRRLVEGREFTSLTNVRQELSEIRSETAESEELLNRKFTKANLQDELGNNTFSVLHLATHSQFSSQLENTFILAWDRLLQIEDLVNIVQSNNLNPIQLLVLSACQTAKGDRFATLGLAGITVRAGVTSTIATLWSVDDLATTEIVDRFYEQLNQGVPKAKAIQQAQLAFLNQDRRPYFWSPFILLGNWL